MGGDFDDVICGVGMRFGEVGDHDFVDAVSRTSLSWDGAVFWAGARLDQFAEYGAPSFKFMLEAQHRKGNCPGIWSRKTNDADSTAARRSGDGDDGVVQVHEAILTACCRFKNHTTRYANIRRATGAKAGRLEAVPFHLTASDP